jgi:hypothetical protein
MDDNSSAAKQQSIAPKKASKKQSFPSPAEILQRVQQNHARTQAAVRNKQSGAFYTDHGS